MSERIRLDTWLVEQGHFESRQQALRAVQAGDVRLDGQVVDKAGIPVVGSPVVEIRARPPYVSRGGEKLAGALATFEISIAGRTVLDSGISTGGFTDCLLQRGAARVYGVDVGYGQLAWSLRQDPRVVLRERTNLRHLTPQELYAEGSPATLATLDLSFISLTKILPNLWTLLASPREGLLLIKPQFEAGRRQVGKKGVVRDPQIQAEAVFKVWTAAQSLGWHFRGATYSPAPGPAGNIEYWLWISEDPGEGSLTLPEALNLARHAQALLS